MSDAELWWMRIVTVCILGIHAWVVREILSLRKDFAASEATSAERVTHYRDTLAILCAKAEETTKGLATLDKRIACLCQAAGLTITDD